MRALRNIRKGAFIGEYTGELLSDAETARPERTDTYFFETRVVSATNTAGFRKHKCYFYFRGRGYSQSTPACTVISPDS